MAKSLGLALGGGGARGICHVGVLKALEDEGIKPQYIAGTSMGSVVGACYAMGMSLDEMTKIIMDIKPADIMDFDVAGLTKLGIMRSKKVQKLFLKYIGEVTFEQLKIPFVCTSTDILTGKEYIFKSGPVATGVQASSAIPSIFRPVPYKDMLLVDGGVSSRVPIREVKDLGADVVIACDALANTFESVEKPKNLIGMLMRLYDVMDARQASETYRHTTNICDLILMPEMKGMSQYAIKELDRAFDEGYKTTKDNMDKIKKLLN